MKSELIGCSDRGTYSATLSEDALAALAEMNGSDPDGSDNPSTDNSDNEYNHSGQEKPPYFHPPYVI